MLLEREIPEDLTEASGPLRVPWDTVGTLLLSSSLCILRRRGRARRVSGASTSGPGHRDGRTVGGSLSSPPLVVRPPRALRTTGTGVVGHPENVSSGRGAGPACRAGSFVDATAIEIAPAVDPDTSWALPPRAVCTSTCSGAPQIPDRSVPAGVRFRRHPGDGDLRVPGGVFERGGG